VAEGRIENTVPFIFSMRGESLDVGIDTCSAVGPYREHFPFTGGIDRDEGSDFEDGQFRGALAHQ
jgi:arylsulfatase